MADFNLSNQSQNSDSNSTNQTLAHMSNLAPFSMNLTQAASLKLDKDNFLLWKKVIMPIVRGHGLEGYLLGSKVQSDFSHSSIAENQKMIHDYGSIPQHCQTYCYLEIARKKIDHTNLVTQVLAGLDEEYTPIVVQVNRRDQVSWHELSSTLMTFESSLEYLSQVRNNFGSINLTQGSPQNANSYSGRGSRCGRNSNFRDRARDRRRFGRSNEVRHLCQICGLSNHNATWCYNRFDEKYIGKRLTDQNRSLNPFAYTASPSSVEDQAWYADSGASHHVTTDKENVDQAKEYGGKKNMVVGNGNSQQISHIGSKKFDVDSDKTLILQKLLQVPKIKKNLICVSKLTVDNNVPIEFFPNGCVVKDLPTRKALVQGKLEDGLYQLNLSTHNSSTSSAIYHQPNSLILFSTPA
ncbi:Uncharacterized protein Adt_03740 [Abeliophyllum distichum]|uniref:Retrovirus-related Pol polyprotein from transposon TNT 1-94-like beta-barrel domain-containing protein n=1 Tax=Abeliophyllum distichum TaxID=126358 RepID=A0ABD1VZK7_9LAMI